MIIPNFYTDSNGDIVFEIRHTSEDKKEIKKEIFDRKSYINWITVNPIDHKIVKFECECHDFILNRQKETPCKHIRQSIKLLEQNGVVDDSSCGCERKRDK